MGFIYFISTTDVVALLPDPYITNTSLLLKMKQTNGANNSTIVDSSSSQVAITNNGNTTQGSFHPYGNNWSVNFNNSSPISCSGSAVTVLSGDHTIEAWIYPTAPFTGTYYNVSHYLLCGIYGTNAWYVLGIGATGYLVMSRDGNTYTDVPGVIPQLNMWSHLAFVTSGQVLTIFLNGVSVATRNMGSANWNTSSAILYVGSASTVRGFFNGYISNLRIVNGTALYTSTFTPQATPLTNISGTTLLMCNSNKHKDYSNNQYPITTSIINPPSISRFNPFIPTSTFSSNTGYGSMYFNGSTDYLTTGTAITIGSNDFTVEAWIYRTNSTAGYCGILCNQISGNNNTFRFEVDTSNKLLFTAWNAMAWSITGSITIPTFQWTHVALMRSSGTTKIFVNGVADGSSTGSPSFVASNFVLGSEVNSGPSSLYTGYISDARVVVGIAVYSMSGFTPPTSPLTNTIETALLVRGDNIGMYDATTNNNIVLKNAPVTSITVKKFNSSVYFNGTADFYLRFINNKNTQFVGDFTIEFWSNLISKVSSYPCLVNNYTSYTAGSIGIFAGHDSATTTKYQVTINGAAFPSAATIQSTSNIVYNTWNHIALVRVGSIITLYINGASEGSVSNSSTISGVGQYWYIGADGDSISTSYLNGYIEDFRITNGIARYTANFTPPTGTFVAH